MTQVTIPPALGGDGLPFSDDGTSARDMRGLGYAANFFPMLSQVMAAVQVGVQAAGAVATGSTNVNSTTNLAIGTGAKALTVETGKALVPGMIMMLAYRAAPENFMAGQVTSYDSATGALVLAVTVKEGAGTYADWAGSITGLPAQRTIAHRAITGADTAAASDIGKYLSCTGSSPLAFDAAAALGSGWWCYVQNTGAGDVPLEPDGAETIDGIAGFVLYPGAARLVLCDGTALRSIPLSGGTKTFTTTGSYVWAPGVQQWDADLIGGGGGGGGGARAAGVRYGGGGGGAGERWKTSIAASEVTVGASVTCTVGAKGAGGAAAASDGAAAADGTAGGSSSVGSLRSVAGGTGASTGATSSAYGQGATGGGTGQMAGSAPGAGNCYVAISSTVTTEWGGPSGRAGGSGGAGMQAKLGLQRAGAGGAAAAIGAAGANGANPGDGGSGGSGNLNGTAAGKGGDGADGKITIVEVI